jgi:hypothetical protein
MLRSFLAMPVMEKAIDSPREIVASGLPVHMYIYGVDVERAMAVSHNVDVKYIWEHILADSRDTSVVVGIIANEKKTDAAGLNVYLKTSVFLYN